MASKKTEDAIRTYLNSLGRPDRPVVDREAVNALKQQIKAESDPIEKAKLISARDREMLGFVEAALAWSEEAGVTGDALAEMGVPVSVLRQAGFDVVAKARPQGRAVRASSGQRSPAIPLDDVAAAARKLGSGWKLSDLAAVLQREPMTVRNYINKLVEQRVIADLGDDPRHGGRGRAPKIYGMA